MKEYKIRSKYVTSLLVTRLSFIAYGNTRSLSQIVSFYGKVLD